MSNNHHRQQSGHRALAWHDWEMDGRESHHRISGLKFGMAGRQAPEMAGHEASLKLPVCPGECLFVQGKFLNEFTSFS